MRKRESSSASHNVGPDKGEAMDTPYNRFRWLIEGRVAGAPHPEIGNDGGLLAVADFLREQGVGAIITLQEAPLMPDPTTLGFRYLFHQTDDLHAPSDLVGVVRFMDECLSDDCGVMAHCFAGIGRTGTALCAWLLKNDAALSPEDAVTRVRETYIPDYAKCRFPEHERQFEALKLFAEARTGNGSQVRGPTS